MLGFGCCPSGVPGRGLCWRILLHIVPTLRALSSNSWNNELGGYASYSGYGNQVQATSADGGGWGFGWGSPSAPGVGGVGGPGGQGYGATEPLILFMSSPHEKKVSYVEMNNFQADQNSIRALVGAGLSKPSGIAYSATDSALYVADPGAKRIMRYQIEVQPCPENVDPMADPSTRDWRCFPETVKYKVVVQGVPSVIMTGVSAEWVSVDPDGNVYYTDQEARSVNKIPQQLVSQIRIGSVAPENVLIMSEKEVQALATTTGVDINGTMVATTTALPTPRGPNTGAVYALYEAGMSDAIGTPGGLVVSGTELFFGNRVGAQSKGDVVQCMSDPEQVPPMGLDASGEEETFTTVPLSRNAFGVYGVVRTFKHVIFSDQKNNVYGVSPSLGTQNATTLTRSLGAPRGLAWDGDNTVFIADETNDAIFWMGCSTLMADRPITPVVRFSGPFGLALLKGSDPEFARAIEERAGTLAAAGGALRRAASAVFSALT